MHLKRKIVKTFAVLLSAAVLGLFGTAEYYSSRLPEVLTTEAGEALEIAEYPEITCSSVQEETAAFSDTLPTARHVTLSLFGAIPVKSVEICEEEAPTLVAAGIPFGIKLLMDGVMVTELSDVESIGGEISCPAADVGIQVGDVIRLADNISVTSNSELQNIVSGSGGRAFKLSVSRDGSEFIAYLTPVFSAVSRKNGQAECGFVTALWESAQ
ncbi:MAG: hypothetical protein LUG26_08985 [Ruminococcus sp.]|nr:hypothetical protein [Ruminococcus sp.]